MKLSFKNVNLSINKQNILKNINIEFESGKIVLILGPSGAGKSSLLRLMNALTDPDNGSIFLDNQEFKEIKTIEIRKKIGMIFQKPALFEGTVFDNLIWGLKTQKKVIDKTEIEKILINLEIPLEYLEKNIESLSVGEQQRICIIRSLLVNPDILLFDEPVSALDPQRAKKVLELIKRINTDFNKSIFLVSHILKSSIELAHKICFMHSGEIIFYGDKEDFKKSDNPLIQKFMEEENE